MARAKRTQDRPFPWRCGSCDEKEIYRSRTPYKTTIKYEGRPYDVEMQDLEVPTCRKCGEVVFDNHAGHQINAALRKQLGLLQPEQIRAGRTELNLSQKEFASQLGVAEESVSRWETGSQIQSRSVDRQIRVFFEFPEVREILVEFETGRVFGEIARTASPRETPTGGRSESEKLLAALVHGRAELRRLVENMPTEAISILTREWPDTWADCSSFWMAAANYARRVPAEEIRLITVFLGSQWHRTGTRDQLRVLSNCFRSYSRETAPMFERLGRITRDLEDVPECEAVPLLDHFSGLLAVWKRRLGESPAERSQEKEGVAGG
jgi:putative zinc finger/helix-turn-helix YgiT family protein